jgi:hypothetical protein
VVTAVLCSWSGRQNNKLENCCSWLVIYLNWIPLPVSIYLCSVFILILHSSSFMLHDSCSWKCQIKKCNTHSLRFCV